MYSQINTKSRNYEKNWIKFVAVFLFILGFIDILSAWLSFDSSRLNLIDHILDYQIITGSRYLVIFTGIAALILAPALYRQKRVAWYAAVITLGISGFAHIFKDADVEEAGISLILFGILLPLFKYCKVKSDPVRARRGGLILAVAVIFVLFYTILGLFIFSDKLGVDTLKYPVWSMTLDALAFNTSALKPVGLEAKFYVNSLFLINSICYLTGLIFALSPVIARRLPNINYDKYKKLTKEKSSQPVQFFALNNNYQHFYYKNEETEGLISYKVFNRVALAIGNPCFTGSLDQITSKWLNMVYEHDWIPAVYQAQGDFVEIMKQKNFNAVPIGVEAVVNLEKFTLEGKKMQQLRTGKNKAEKEGWHLRNYKKSDWNKVKNLDLKWLSVHGKKENSFAMGKSSAEYLEETKTSLLLDKEDNLLAYINNIELPQSNTRSVDLMRRDPSSPQGVMEYLFLKEILSAKESGKAFYDLGFSPLARADEVFSDNKTVSKLFELIFKKQKKYYDFQGLHMFKSKFNPEWQQSYLLYTNTLELPMILMGLLKLNNQ